MNDDVGFAMAPPPSSVIYKLRSNPQSRMVIWDEKEFVVGFERKKGRSWIWKCFVLGWFVFGGFVGWLGRSEEVAVEGLEVCSC